MSQKLIEVAEVQRDKLADENKNLRVQNTNLQSALKDLLYYSDDFSSPKLYFNAVASAREALDAAAPVGLTDAVEALRRVCTHDKRSSEQINRDWDHARSVLARIDGDKQGDTK